MSTPAEISQPIAPVLKDALTGLAAAIRTFVPVALSHGVDPDKLRAWMLDLYDAEAFASAFDATARDSAPTTEGDET